ncbi:MAG TPA: DUF1127 domain-containing protein [Pseudolabrys sp.]|nr:DUF1127 domain-containing protein [Pseudolabrys sp.]
MSANYPVLPVAGGTLARAFVAGLSLVTYWFKQIARARRHRREAAMLAGLEGHMLADIGITRSDLRDAFSEPFWEDPTALLHERAIERRWNQALMRADIAASEAVSRSGFHRPRTDRPARHTV